MLSLLKLIFGGLSKKKSTKSIIDSKLGKLTTEYSEKDNYYSWDFELKIKKGKKVAFSLDGNLNGPFNDVLQKAYQMVDFVEDLFSEVQMELDTKFAEKKINLANDYTLEDVFIYKDEETGSVDFELEFYTEGSEIMISVEFVNDKIKMIEFY